MPKSPELALAFRMAAQEVLEHEWAATARWYRQGEAILRLDEKLGRSAFCKELQHGVHMTGSAFQLRARRVSEIRRTTKAFKEMGFTTIQDVYGCPLPWAIRMMHHVRGGRLTAEGVKIIMEALRMHKSSDLIHVTDINTEAGLNKIKRLLDIP